MAGDIPEFEVKAGDRRILLLRTKQLRIGTRGTCELSIDDPVAAEEHCIVRFEDNETWIEDLGSSTGTFLNGEEVQKKEAVQQGDELVFGVTRLTVSEKDLSTSRVVFSLDGKSFYFVKPTKNEFNSDPDRWVRTEVQLGRFAPVRRGNWIALACAVVFLALLLVVPFRNAIVQPGELCSSHAVLFTENVPQEYFESSKLAREQGCKVCHEPFNGTPSSKCSQCHGEMMRNNHPFFLQVPRQDASKVSRTIGDHDCNLCHIDHRGRLSREGGFVPDHTETENSCVLCHENTELGDKILRDAPDVSEIDRKDLEQTPQNRTVEFSSFRFAHADHVDLRNRETGDIFGCENCHRRNPEALAGAVEIASRYLRDFLHVPFETCARCHVIQDDAGADEQLRGWWPQEDKNIWMVNWHGTEDFESTCRNCHVEPERDGNGEIERIDDAIRSVERFDSQIELSEYRRFKALYRVELRSHEEQFSKHSSDKHCSECHRRNRAVIADEQTGLRTGSFWHASHVPTGLFPESPEDRRQASTSCQDCHDDIVSSAGLVSAAGDRDYLYKKASVESCGECHKGKAEALDLEREFPPERPRWRISKRANFPHKFHMNFSHPELEDGCFTCHYFDNADSSGAGGLGSQGLFALVKTRTETTDCTHCHAKHANVAGGACVACHPMADSGADAKSYNVYLGKNPPANRQPPLRLWPAANTFSHFSFGHIGLLGSPPEDSPELPGCATCHDMKSNSPDSDLRLVETLADVPIPDESLRACRDCHLHEKKRFHWR